MKKQNLKTSLKAMKSLAFEEVNEFAEIGAKAVYSASRNKGTLAKLAGGAYLIKEGVENDSTLLTVGGGLLFASGAMKIGDVIKDFEDFDSNKYLASIGEVEIEDDNDDEVEVIEVIG